MLSYRQLAELGFCPAKNYGWMTTLPRGFKLPEVCDVKYFKHLPLQLQVFYNFTAENSVHKLIRQLD
jgi:hypothetical protein